MTGLLPGGYVDRDGVVHREVELIPLTGRDEELLVASRSLESASLVTLALSRCLRRIGGISPVSEEVARRLLVADRQYLLLKLREEAFGDRVQASLFCPWLGCGKRITVSFSTKDIPVRESEAKGPVHTMTLSAEAVGEHGEAYRDIAFRLPNGADQEVVSRLLSENEAQALTMLLGRCVLSIGHIKQPDQDVIDRLSPLARLEIERQMEALAPSMDLTIDVSCSECGREFAVPFDLHGFLFGELRTSGDLLYREVHYLAYHYHWSEKEIMEMPRDKRHRYIEVLADELERLNNAV